MKQHIVKPTESNKQRMLRRPRFLYMAIAGVLVIGACTGGYLIYKSRYSKTRSQAVYEKGLHNENYSKLNSFKLKGIKSDTGMVFKKPTAYLRVLETTDHTQAGFSRTLKSPPAPLGALHVLSVASTSITPAGTSNLSKILSDPRQPAYKAAVQPLKDFLSARFSPLYDISYHYVRPVSLVNSQSKAWRLDFSAAAKQAAKPAAGVDTSPAATTDPARAQPLPAPALAGLEDYKGAVEVVVGNNAYYYFLVYNTSYNWDNNYAIFTDILGSIKVDQ